MKSQHIIPAIIPDSLMYLETRLKDLSDVVRRVQVDVMDGTYAPTVTWPYDKEEKNDFEYEVENGTGLPYWQDFDFEIDLMTTKPEEKVLDWALSGARCIIFHVESTDRLNKALERCKENRVEMALAIKPSTDISVLEKYVEDALFVQVMGNDVIGRHGIELDEKALETIRSIKNRWNNIVVGADIGVNAETIPKLCEAGVTRFASGSAVFNYTSPAGAVAHLESVVSKCLKD